MIAKKVNFTEGQKNRSNQHYEFKVLAGSVKKGGGNQIGADGEIAVFDEFNRRGITSTFDSTYNYDIIAKKKTVEVKTRSCNSAPQDDYNVGFFVSSSHQKPDIYAFARVLNDRSACFLQGLISYEEFHKKAKLYKKGEKDENGFKFKADSLVIKANELTHRF